MVTLNANCATKNVAVPKFLLDDVPIENVKLQYNTLIKVYNVEKRDSFTLLTS